MTKEDIIELMEIKGWSRTQLAAQLDVTETTIFGWLSGRRHPGGPAKILMRQFLAEAKNGKRKKVAVK